MSKSNRRGTSKSSGRVLIGRPGRGRSRTAADAIETFQRPNKTLPVLITLALWRWRWELVCVVTFCWAMLWLTHTKGLPATAALAAIAAPLAIMLPIGVTRRFLRNRIWCVITRHRVRACLSEMRTLNYSGNLPFILFCRSTKVGESVWLFMRPGLSHTDLENRAETLAAACWAREARIERNRRNAALIRIDIDRRDPLAKAHITSPLIDETADLPNGEVIHGSLNGGVLEVTSTNSVQDTTGPVSATATQQPASGANGSGDTYVSTDPASDHADHAVHEPTRKVKKPKTTVHADTASRLADDGPVVLLNGEDVSDYV